MSDATLLRLRGAEVVVTMDATRREIRGGGLVVAGTGIEFVGSDEDVSAWIAADPPARTPARTIDASGTVVVPGLVNCHHHLYQSLTRSIGTSRGHRLIDWLKLLYPVWACLDPEAAYASAKLAIAELMLSGATTIADHLYLYPNGVRIDDEIAAARELGVRFHPTRGGMNLGQSTGGFAPDSVVDDTDTILRDCERAIATFHDPGPRSMLRIGVAPCSLATATDDLMREAARLARGFEGVHLHTHCCETLEEGRMCLERYGRRPLEIAESLGWVGKDVWFAHMVHPTDVEIDKLAVDGSGVAHCPTSNMILASGIAPVRRMIDRKVRVGLGVDGSASNDGNHMLGEARQAILLQRVGWPGFESHADRLSTREALELATLGGARVLGRDDIGSLEAGKAADFVAFRVDDIGHAGALGDPVAALLTCTPAQAWLSVINGRIVVEEGMLVGVAMRPLIERHNAASLRMLRQAGYA
jgi:cytosine/adenosine deaminase-related metal-dependent hydrolase